MARGLRASARAGFGAVAFCAALAAGGPVAAAQEEKGTALQTCLAALEPPWNEEGSAERRVWQAVCREDLADLAGSRDAAVPLNATFLRAILTRKRYLSVIPPKGVRIRRALFEESVDLDDIRVPFGVWLDDSRLEAGGSFSGAKIGGSLTLDGTMVSGTLDMESMTVGGGLLMRTNDPNAKASFAKINFRGAKIDGLLSLIGATVSGTLDMDNLSVGRSLYMRTEKTETKASFADIILRGAEIDGQLDLTGATVSGTLDMDSMTVGAELLMRTRDPNAKASFAKIALYGAKIDGQLSLIGATVSGTLDMDSMTVGGDLFMRTRDPKAEASFQDVDLAFAKIGSNLDLRGARFGGKQFDLSGARIVGELRLAGKNAPPPAWHGGVRMNLRNARAGAIQDSQEPGFWPVRLELEGFVYDRLGGFGADPKGLPRTRPVNWYQDWLKRDDSFALQPYEHLARILRLSGENGKADTILFEKREEQRKQAWCAGQPPDPPCEIHMAEALWLEIQKWLIGHGYRVHWAAGWVALIWLLGIVVLALSGENKRNNIPWGIAYSLDMLLPVIKLRDKHYDIDLEGWARYYFYAHMLAGYVLIGFLIAGLSGLTR